MSLAEPLPPGVIVLLPGEGRQDRLRSYAQHLSCGWCGIGGPI